MHAYIPPIVLVAKIWYNDSYVFVDCKLRLEITILNITCAWSSWPMSIISMVSLTHLGSKPFDSLFITTTLLSVAFLQAIVA